MTAIYIYNGRVIARGNLQIIPHEGNFIEFQAEGLIFKVNAVMFKTVLNGEVGVIIYLIDVMGATERYLRDYK